MKKETNKEIIHKIHKFFEGRDDGIKYIVNVETHKFSNQASCIIDNPVTKEKSILKVPYTPFLFIKDLKEHGISLYNGDKQLLYSKMQEYGITYEKLRTGQQPRLERGYKILIKSSISFKAIEDFFKDGGLDLYENAKDKNGKVLKNDRGYNVRVNDDLYYKIPLDNQFFISTGNRLYKGFTRYEDVHKLTFDIETTSLRPKLGQVFQIGVRDNRGFETVLEVNGLGDKEEQKRIKSQFWSIIDNIKPSIITGYFSETFDFDYILERMKILEMDVDEHAKGLNGKGKLKRVDSKVKIGGGTEDYIHTKLWGYSIIDTIHAVKKAQAIDSNMEETGLKYVTRYSKNNKPDRMYIDGSEGNIGRYWKENKFFFINPENNNYVEIPEIYQSIISNICSGEDLNKYLNEDQNFAQFVNTTKEELGKLNVIKGRDIVRRYLLDDLWETETVDNNYNQPTFLLSKKLPVPFERTATMGTAAMWNDVMTAYSYENKVSVPIPDEHTGLLGGLPRNLYKGYSPNMVKIDYASLYPMIMLTYGIFPHIDIDGVMEMMLIYMTTVRNIYKKLNARKKLSDDELDLLYLIGEPWIIEKIQNKKEFTESEIAFFKTMQSPLKILNNSLFGALGSSTAFKWNDILGANRITATGRTYLRWAVDFFQSYGCKALYMVTDGINFYVPDITNKDIEGNLLEKELPVQEAWQYDGLQGIDALIEYYNDKFLPDPYMAVDNDGVAIGCMNASRNNYAILKEKNGKRYIEKTGGTFKSKTKPAFISEFIEDVLYDLLGGDSWTYYEKYCKYVEDIFYKQIPLKKIASKARYKTTIGEYKRGKELTEKVKKIFEEKYLYTEVDGKRVKNKILKEDRTILLKKVAKECFNVDDFAETVSQAHLDHIINHRNKEARELYLKHISNNEKELQKLTDDEIIKKVDDYISREPELDSYFYYINIGTRKSHGDTKMLKDPNTGEEYMASVLLDKKQLEDNPDLLGEYNVAKYIEAFDKSLKNFLHGFDPEVAERFKSTIEINKVSNSVTGKKEEELKLILPKFEKEELKLSNFEDDSFEEAMTMEDKEGLFWEKVGLDPTLIWDGVIFPEKYKERKGYKQYCNVHQYVQNVFKDRNIDKRVRTVNDTDIQKDEYLLTKDGSVYSLHYFNGQHYQVVKEQMQIPQNVLNLN